MLNKLSVFVMIILFSAGCFDSSSDKNKETRPDCKYTKADALVIVIENLDNPGTTMEYLYTYRKNAMLEIFAEVFDVPKAVIENLTISQIFDEYGEDWQISEIKKAASPYYNEIISLTDSSATYEGFVNALKDLSGKGLTVDIIFALHGSNDSVQFFDGLTEISKITEAIRSNSIAVRSLYQTCCFGSSTIDDWADAGITAVNGAAGSNAIVLFSPAYFVQNWAEGYTFKDAVKQAYEMEKVKLRSYSGTVPEFSVYITDANLSGSFQKTGGCDNSLSW